MESQSPNGNVAAAATDAPETIESLAKEHKEMKSSGSKKSVLRLISIPIWVLISILMTAAVASITIPMFMMISSTSQSSIGDLSRHYIREAVSRASENLESAIFNLAGTLDGMFEEPYFNEDVVNYVKFGLQASPKLPYEMLRRIQSHGYISGLMCTTYGTNAVGPYGPFTNVTLFFASYNYGNILFAHADPSTNYSTTVNMYSPDLSQVVGNFTLSPLGIVNPNVDLTFNALMPGKPVQKPFFGVGMEFWSINYHRMYYPGNTAPGFYGCYIGLNAATSLVPLLQSVALTNNTIVMLVERKTGLLIGTNKANSTTVNDIRLDNGEQWFLATSLFTVKGEDFVVVVGFPRSDMFAEVDAASKKAIIFSISLGVTGVLLTGCLIFVFLLPLQHMANSMKQLTKFDFSSLESGNLDRRSMMFEIKQVEDVFFSMVTAFAFAISKNKQLRSTSISSTGRGSGDAGKTLTAPPKPVMTSRPLRGAPA
ncbi:hypothetical protein HDU97_000352 [Phlyctochytrium planicorne]|nr:hypothetical protein HDU97_000352 [Phlyctochytrium planicorne]